MRTRVRSFMEFASDPLNREFLAEQHGCTEEEREKQLREKVDNIYIVLRGVFILSSVDKGLEGYPDGQRPSSEGNISRMGCHRNSGTLQHVPLTYTILQSSQCTCVSRLRLLR